MWRTAVFIVLAAAVNCRSDIPEEDLLDDLFYSYSKHARPSIGPDHTVKVSHSLTLTRIVSMDHRVLTADTWQMMKWQDSRLMWDPDDYSQLEYINIPDDLIWIPDIMLYNNAAATSGKTYASIRVVVDRNGDAVWVPATRVTAYCDEVTSSDRADVEAGDFRCTLKFGSWTYQEKSLNMTIDGDGLLMGDYSESPDYEIVDHAVKREDLHYACCPDPYTSITYTLWLRRKCLQTIVQPESCDSDVQGDQASVDDDSSSQTDDDGETSDSSDDGSKTDVDTKGDDTTDDTDGTDGEKDSNDDNEGDDNTDTDDDDADDNTDTNDDDAGTTDTKYDDTDDNTDTNDDDTDDNTDTNDDDTDDNTDTNDDDTDDNTDTNTDDADDNTDTDDDDNTDTDDNNEANTDDDSDSIIQTNQNSDNSIQPVVQT